VTDAVVDRVRQAVSDIFGVPMSEVTVDSSPQTVEAWDSLGHLNLMLALEQSFGVQLSPEEISSMLDVGLVADTLRRRAA
jgi:acyl carrier protein